MFLDKKEEFGSWEKIGNAGIRRGKWEKNQKKLKDSGQNGEKVEKEGKKLGKWGKNEKENGKNGGKGENKEKNEKKMKEIEIGKMEKIGENLENWKNGQNLERIGENWKNGKHSK